MHPQSTSSRRPARPAMRRLRRWRGNGFWVYRAAGDKSKRSWRHCVGIIDTSRGNPSMRRTTTLWVVSCFDHGKARITCLPLPRWPCCGRSIIPAAWSTGSMSIRASTPSNGRDIPVTENHLHFWAEVMLPSGSWVAIEPTPGYDLLIASPSWAETLLGLVVGAAEVVWAHPWQTATVCLGLCTLLYFRREIADWFATARWRWETTRSSRRCVAATLWLIECRCRWAGGRRLWAKFRRGGMRGRRKPSAARPRPHCNSSCCSQKCWPMRPRGNGRD